MYANIDYDYDIFIVSDFLNNRDFSQQSKDIFAESFIRLMTIYDAHDNQLPTE